MWGHHSLSFHNPNAILLIIWTTSRLQLHHKLSLVSFGFFFPLEIEGSERWDKDKLQSCETQWFLSRFTEMLPGVQKLFSDLWFMLVFEHLAYELLQESMNPNQSNFQKERSCLTINLDTRGSGILNPGIQQLLPGETPLGDLVFQRTPFKARVSC